MPISFCSVFTDIIILRLQSIMYLVIFECRRCDLRYLDHTHFYVNNLPTPDTHIHTFPHMSHAHTTGRSANKHYLESFLRGARHGMVFNEPDSAYAFTYTQPSLRFPVETPCVPTCNIYLTHRFLHMAPQHTRCSRPQRFTAGLRPFERLNTLTYPSQPAQQQPNLHHHLPSTIVVVLGALALTDIFHRVCQHSEISWSQSSDRIAVNSRSLHHRPTVRHGVPSPGLIVRVLIILSPHNMLTAMTATGGAARLAALTLLLVIGKAYEL